MAADDVTVLNVLMPASTREPIVILENGAALRMVLADREAINALDAAWDVPGVYILLFPRAVGAKPSERGLRAYVGKAGPGGMRSRLQTHVLRQPEWTKALLVARDTSAGFNSAHAGWLESRLWSVADAAALVDLVNGNRPSDETLEHHERAWLEGTIEPIRQVMRLVGYPLDPLEDEPISAPRRSHHGVSVKQLVDAGLISAGSTIEYTGRGHTGVTAVIHADGSIDLDGTRYWSPSAAGAAVRGGAVNGWAAWAQRDAANDLITLAEIRERLRSLDGDDR